MGLNNLYFAALSIVFAVLSCMIWLLAAKNEDFKLTLALGVVALPFSIACILCLHLSTLQISKYHTLSSALTAYFLEKFTTVFATIVTKRSLNKTWTNPRQSQEQFLHDFLKKNALTEYGKRYNFGDVKSMEEFRRRHPIAKYEEFESYITRMAKGETNVLTAEAPGRFCLTSGTTGRGKLIPIVPALEKSIVTHGSIMSSVIIETFSESSPLQKGVMFYTAPKMRKTEGGHQLGPISRIEKSMKKILVSYATPGDGFDIGTPYESIYVHLLFGLRDRDSSRMIAGFTTTFYSIMKQLQSDWPKLTEDIRNGSLQPDLNIPQDIRKSLEDALLPDPERAAELEAEFRQGFDGILHRIWPKMSCIIAIDIGGHKEKLQNTYAKGVTMYGHLYAASEGIIAVNLWPRDKDESYVLFPDIALYEFVPEENMDSEQPKTKFIDELQIGQNYEIILTTCFGLCRYRFGDVIKCVGYHYNTPRIAFQYRSGQLMNVCGEKVTQLVMDKVVKEAASQWANVSVVDYACAESLTLSDESLQRLYRGEISPFYLMFIELEGEMDDMKLTTRQKEVIDEKLCNNAFTYNSYREKGSMARPEIFIVHPGSFQKLQQYLLENTMSCANQIKSQRKLRTPEMVDFMLQNVM